MNEARSQVSARLDALEERIAHQDKTIVDMSDVIASQWRTIETLQRHVAALREEVRNSGPQRANPEPPPPHY